MSHPLYKFLYGFETSLISKCNFSTYQSYAYLEGVLDATEWKNEQDSANVDAPLHGVTQVTEIIQLHGFHLEQLHSHKFEP